MTIQKSSQSPNRVGRGVGGSRCFGLFARRTNNSCFIVCQINLTKGEKASDLAEWPRLEFLGKLEIPET